MIPGIRIRPALGYALAALLAGSALWQAPSTARGADPDNGQYVFHAAGCKACHTRDADDARPLAGGRAFETRYGTFYSPNITPHPRYGIGEWGRAEFVRALRYGIGHDGRWYYPSFPFAAYTGMTDDDIVDLWAYLQSREPIAQANRGHELDFPYAWRGLMMGWQALHFDPGAFRPRPERSAQWNRGAYLVRHLGHCGECHTPRNALGAKQADRELAGNPNGPEGKAVPNITPHRADGIGDWSKTDIAFYLEIGFEPSGDVAGGAMAEVIRESTGELTAEDRAAIATYLKSLPALPAR